MSRWPTLFLSIAIVAALLGHIGAATWSANMLFFVFFSLFVESLLFRRRGPLD
jgi:uncharacterized membrane protein YtjA (UPF0391 family)